MLNPRRIKPSSACFDHSSISTRVLALSHSSFSNAAAATAARRCIVGSSNISSRRNLINGANNQRRTYYAPRKGIIRSNSLLIDTVIRTNAFTFHSSKQLFASMPLGEERVKARNDHLKEEIFSKSTIQAENESSNDTNASTNTKDANDASSDSSPEPKRRRTSEVPISEVLKSKHTLRWVEPIIDRNSTVREAIIECIDSGLAAMLVIDNDNTTSNTDNHDTSVSIQRGKVVGMATSRDLLRIINGGIQDHESEEEIFSRKVGDYMTPITQVIYARPEETIGMCRRIMAQLGVKVLPILSNGRVEGLITARDMNEFGLDAAERGGKKHYLENKIERVGLSTNTSMAEPPSYIRAHLASQQRPLYMNVGMAELPHPFKTPESCGMNRRDYGADEVADNCDLSEDAHFITKVSLSDYYYHHHQQQDDDESEEKIREFTYVGVADGIGSWREYGVDPREFSHSLMQECDNILRENCAALQCSQKVRNKKSKNKVRSNCIDSEDDEKVRKILTPAELLGQAYDRVKADNIIGSSTACIAMFDELRHQVHFSNLGDSGIIVLRHIDSDVAGALKRDKTTPRTERVSDLRVAFVSQQQLKSFNHPFQLGWTGEELIDDHNTDNVDSSFKTAAECCTSSIHIRRGDIIILATDGLFDNVELEDITKIALEWEQKSGFIEGGDIASREKRWKEGSSMSRVSAKTIDSLAKTLVDKARENSLDNSIDSPFAILAKENDIMWSGGMPDDCTIIAMHIVGEPAGQTKQ